MSGGWGILSEPIYALHRHIHTYTEKLLLLLVCVLVRARARVWPTVLGIGQESGPEAERKLAAVVEQGRHHPPQSHTARA